MINIMKNCNIKKTAAILLVAVIAFCGCKKSSENPAAPDGTGQGVSIDKEIDTEDVINLSMSMAKTLNPLVNSDPSVDMVLSLMYEKLIDIDQYGKAVPNIAESWTFNEDKNVAYVKLKPNVCFSDGTRLTAYDVAYSLKTVDNADNSYYRNCVENIKTWTVTDDYTISVTFYNDSVRNIYYLSIPIISRTFYGGEYASADVYTERANGNGYYRLESYKKPDSLVMIASVNCFKGMAKVNQINVIMTKDSETDSNLFSQGITDIIAVDKADAAGAGITVGMVGTSYVTNEYDFIGFNFNNSILKDRNVRQAVAYSVDRNSIMEGIYLSNAEKAYTPVSTSSWLYDKTVFGYEYDLSLAKMLLEQSGWRYRNGSDTVRQSMGENPQKLSLRILVNGENDERKQVAIKLAETLRGIGFEINVETVNFSTYKEKLQNGSYDIFVGGWNVSPVYDFTLMFGSSELNGDEGNLIYYSSEKMDGYLTACKQASGDEEMLKAYSDLQKYIAQELPYVSLVYRKSKVYTGNRIEGSMSPSVHDVLGGIEKVSIKK